MKRRRFFLSVAVLAVVLAGGLAVLIFLPRSPISQRNCDRIQLGMSEAEVESILGGPQGNHQDRQVDINVPLPPRQGLFMKVWIGNDGAALVYFDKANKVGHVHFAPALNRDDSFLGRIRRWLRL
jgi:hypothetical protein